MVLLYGHTTMYSCGIYCAKKHPIAALRQETSVTSPCHGETRTDLAVNAVEHTLIQVAR